ncbi:MAG: HAMP domain-containing histidine kinase [Prevotella sp.]|nr:HAMP domain-containing histidine kinase [Bacteroidaceae bacterium]MBP3574299.1 HAMP domain-containing histidine kinase [Prevotella sp.]
MESRFKFIYGLTICAIVAYSIVQGYWLYSRYQLSLEEYKSELYCTIIACAEEEMAIRNTLPHPPRFYGNRLRKTSEIKGDNVVETWRYEVFALDTLQYVPKGTDAHTYLLDYIASLHDSIPAELPKGLEYFAFTCDSKGHEDMGTSQLVEALNRFTVDHQHPFQKELLDSILRSRDIAAQSVTTTKADTMIWQPSMQTKGSIWQPVMQVSYPYDIFEGQEVVVTTAICISPVIRKMAYTLLITILLSFFLIFCLVYQILTIRKQRHIETIRQEFLHTMIHELKRPISTLKMCVSFMGNERMMQDVESKQKILSSSYNELDNLTSYFSKLRDITLSDATEIPLVKSDFSLRELMEECIGKQNIPSDKEVRMEIVAKDDLEILADRMHLANIVCNLLENAIKYSREAVTIRMDYRMREDGMVQICVADNGIGIAKADQRYVFDKFYRSESAKDKAIPGIGLGLSYVKLLVEAHGGSISLDSTEGEGTTFTILIPQTDGKDKDITR